MRRRTVLAAVLAAVLLVITAASAHAAAPPANDGRDSATPLTTLPATVQGTTAGATVAPTDPPSRCAQEDGSVWYRIAVGTTAPAQLAIQVDARGELDASVDVFVMQRSQNLPVTCQRTDKNGEAVFTFRPQAQTTYLIRVAQLSNSDSGTFQLSAFVPPPPASPPGATLAAGGASGSLARVVAASSAYATHLTAGVSYVVNLVSRIDGCMGLSLYGPGTHAFGSDPVAGYRCQGYRLFTPTVTGTYSALIHADGNASGPQPYHLQIAPAGPAQTTPGIPLANYARVRAQLAGNRVQVQRLYRFDVTARSNLELDLHAGSGTALNLELRANGGRILDCSCGRSGNQTLTATTKPGRYYVDVRTQGFDSGSFSLLRRTRAITYTAVRIAGSRYAVLPPGEAATVSVFVSAGADGPASVEIERFDPISGWQYNRTVRVPVTDGSGSFQFVPPSTGQWLAEASFLGSRGFSPSASKVARLLSAGPLTDQVAAPLAESWDAPGTS